MEDDKLYNLNGEVQAVKAEVKAGFENIERRLDEIKGNFAEHLTWAASQKDVNDKKVSAIANRLNKIELRVGLIVGALVFALQAVGKWVISHIGQIIN